MQTKTFFIDNLTLFDASELGSTQYQMIENKTIKTNTYLRTVLSLSLLKDVLFEDDIFENCTFYGTHFENCLFINCLFINCKFQFSKFSSCNFESTSWENCNWGLTLLKDTEINNSNGSNNYSFESNLNETLSTNLSLTEYLNLSA